MENNQFFAAQSTNTQGLYPSLADINAQTRETEREKLNKALAVSLINDPKTDPVKRMELQAKYFPKQKPRQKVYPGSTNYEAEGVKNLAEAALKGTDPMEYAKLAGLPEDVADNIGLAMVPLGMFTPSAAKRIQKLGKKALKRPIDWNNMDRGEIHFLGDEENWASFEVPYDKLEREYKQLIRGDSHKSGITDPDRKQALFDFMYKDGNRPFLVNSKGFPVKIKHGTSNPNLTEFDKYHPDKVDLGWLGRNDAYLQLAKDDKTINRYLKHDRELGRGTTDKGKVMEMYTNIQKPFIADGRYANNLKEAVSKYTLPFDQVNQKRREFGLKAISPEEILNDPNMIALSGHTPEYLNESYRRFMNFEKFLDDNGYDAVMLQLGNRVTNPEFEIGIRNSLGTLKDRTSSGFDPKIKNVYKALPPIGLGAMMMSQEDNNETTN